MRSAIKEKPGSEKDYEKFDTGRVKNEKKII